MFPERHLCRVAQRSAAAALSCPARRERPVGIHRGTRARLPASSGSPFTGGTAARDCGAIPTPKARVPSTIACASLVPLGEVQSQSQAYLYSAFQSPWKPQTSPAVCSGEERLTGPPPSGQPPALHGFTGWGVGLASQRLIWEREGPRGDGQPKVSEEATGLERGSSPTLQVGEQAEAQGGEGTCPKPHTPVSGPWQT